MKVDTNTYNINCHSHGVDTIIESFLKDLRKRGAFFNQGLCFREEAGALSISVESGRINGKALLNIPLSSMPLLCDFQFHLKPNLQLAVTIKNGALNSIAHQIMNHMVELYNKLNKLRAWNECFPFLTLKKSPAIFNILYSFRPQGQKLALYKDLYDKKVFDELLIMSFIGSREFTYKKDALASAGIETPNESEKGLLTIIDFLNHKMGDSSYNINRQTGCMEICAKNVDESGEVFVQYGFMDALQTYLTYGFVDVNSPILFSGKIQFKLKSGLNFVILGMSGGLQRTIPLPAKQSHLNKYLPPGIKRQGEHIVVNELVIPSGKQLSYLTESLSIIIKQCDVGNVYKDPKVLASEVQHIEQQIIASNTQFWQQFSVLVENAIKSDKKFNKTTASDLRNLVDCCVKHCQSYATSKGYN